MNTITIIPYVAVLMSAAFLVNENIVQWALAVIVGDYGVVEGFKDAFKYFTIFGYLFLTAFRIIPYVGLGVVLYLLSKTKFNDYNFPIFIGGICGILMMILWLIIQQ